MATNSEKKKAFSVRILKLHRAVVLEEKPNNRVINVFQLINVEEDVLKFFT
jgi:hypothetical protein